MLIRITYTDGKRGVISLPNICSLVLRDLDAYLNPRIKDQEVAPLRKLEGHVWCKLEITKEPEKGEGPAEPIFSPDDPAGYGHAI